MIKLTALDFKIKIEALERLHKINELAEQQMADWQKEAEKVQIAGSDEYVEKPFIEPHEFVASDYEIIERKFRIDPKIIWAYVEGKHQNTELTLKGGDISYNIKESVEEIDKLLGI